MENTNPTTPETDAIAGYHDEISRIEYEGKELAVKKARNALFWAAGILGFWQIIALYNSDWYIDETIIAVLVIFVGGLILLGFWTRKKPYTAILAGLLLFGLHWLLAIYSYYENYGPTGVAKALVGGIIFRIIILLLLFRALSDAKELQQSKNNIV